MSHRVLASDPKRRWWRLVAVLALGGVALAVTGCGSGGDSQVEARDSDADRATRDEDGSDGAEVDVTGDRGGVHGGEDDGSDGPATDDSADSADGTTRTGPAPGNSSKTRSGTGPGGNDTDGPGRSDPGRSDRSPDRGSGDRSDNEATTVDPLTSRQICSRVTATGVADATGLDIVETSPADSSKTPQCRYYFAGADNSLTNATVSALRPDEDMGGRSGAEAYRHAVDLNRGAAASSGLDVVETTLGVGDESILFENELLRYGIIRYGERIVTVILNAPSADHAAAVALASATAPLAAP